MTTSISPDDLAGVVRPLLATGLLGLDVDGVLAPLVDHADGSRLLPGVDDTLETLGDRTTVAIISGRALESLERLFAFPAGIHVVGSHGLEIRGSEHPALDDRERFVFDQLEIIATRCRRRR